VAAAVVVTGAARGVGRATAIAFAGRGSDLLLIDVCDRIPECPYPLGTREQLDETAARCRAAGARAVSAVADVRRQDEVDAALALGRAELGPVDVLVNDAGVVGPAGMPAHELCDADWSLLLDVDLTGAFRCARAVLPEMAERGSGSIVNVASTAGLVAFPFFAGYVAAKHGLVGLTKALALDYAGHGIRVNAVCPTSIRDEPELDSAMLGGVAGMLGIDRTDYESLALPQHPLGRLVTADEVAAAVVWLALDATGVTGAALPVDAGFTVR
jgi:NAD(P)-dependent dehydrogenase (short-subunit alcohol dehydrogenase family)